MQISALLKIFTVFRNSHREKYNDKINKKHVGVKASKTSRCKIYPVGKRR